ncbi:MAG: transporter [Acidobacteria bacterium]|nr:transporter [Acidobacteriota bacterium]
MTKRFTEKVEINNLSERRQPLARLTYFRLLRLLSSLLVIATVTSVNAAAQQRPLITEDVEIVKPGSIRFELGFDFLQERDFPLSGLNGDQTRIGVISLTFGLASNVEFEMGGVIQNYLSINRQYQTSAVPLVISQTANSTNDFGDLFLAAKIKVRSETERGPGLGFRFGAELPSSNQQRGIGQNQTNFFATAIASKHFGRLGVSGNLGLGILTAPVNAFTQNDVLLYGLSAIYKFNDRLAMVSEVNGRYSTRRNPPLGTESDGIARIGARIRTGGVLFDVSGIRGINRISPSSGISFGVSYEANIFKPAK